MDRYCFRFHATAICCALFTVHSALAQDETPATDGAASQEAVSASEPDSDAADSGEKPVNPELQALWDLKVIYEEACNTSDPSKLKPHLDPDFTGVMVTYDTVSSYQDIEEYWQMIEGYLGDGGTYTVTVNLDKDALTDGNYALAFGTTEDSAVTSSGVEFDFSTKWTAVCRKNEQGEWKIWRIHGSMNPFDNPFTSANSTMTISITAVIAGLIGLVLGFVASRMSRRRTNQ